MTMVRFTSMPVYKSKKLLIMKVNQLYACMQLPQQLSSMMLLAVIAVGIAMLSVSLMYADAPLAYAGGSGSASSDLLLIDNNYYSMEAKTSPAILSGDEEYVLLTLSLLREDSTGSNNHVSEVEYSLKFVDGQDPSVTLATLDAYSPEEELTIMLMPIVSEQNVSGQKVDGSDVWLASNDSPVELEAPIFLEGGLIYIYATILSIDSQPITEQPYTFEIMFSMGEYIPFTLDINDSPTDLVFATYFDKIDKFTYDPQTRTVSAHMSFTWTEDYIESASFIHAEYFIPKTIDLFENHEILLAVNGMDYFGTVDRSPEDEIVVHYLLSSNQLYDLLNNNEPEYTDKLVFDLRAGEMRQQQLEQDAVLEAGDTVGIRSTGGSDADEEYVLLLSAQPSGMLHPNNELTFLLEIRDDIDEPSGDVKYDLELSLGDDVLLSQMGQQTQGGRDKIVVTFEKTGIATLKVSNIADSATSGKFSFIISESHDMSVHGGDSTSHDGMNHSMVTTDKDAMSAEMQAIEDEMETMMSEHEQMMSEHEQMMSEDRDTMNLKEHEEMIQRHESIIESHETLMEKHEEMHQSHEHMMMKMDDTGDAMVQKHHDMVETHAAMRHDHAAMLEDHKTIANEMIEQNDDTNNDNGGCLVATATFGSELAPQVQQLRELRDNTILTTASGTAFMSGFNQFYYTFSPAVADLEREHPILKEAIKVILTPMLASLSLLNYAEIDTESEMLGYGISIILLNLGMYVGIPAFAILKFSKLTRARLCIVKS